MDVSSILSWFYSVITSIWNWIIEFYKDDTAEAIAISISLGALLVAYLSYRIARKALKLQENPSELARLQIEERLEGKVKTTLDVTYTPGCRREGTFTLINRGSSCATDIKVQIKGDSCRSTWIPITEPDCIKGDSAWFKCPNLDPLQEHPISIKWDNQAKAEVEWNWSNADGSRECRSHPFSV